MKITVAVLGLCIVVALAGVAFASAAPWNDSQADYGSVTACLSFTSGDSDGDSFGDCLEQYVGTDPNRGCGTDAWPPDISNDGFVDVIGDISRVAGQFGNKVPPAPARYDIAPDPPDHVIDVIGDISRMAGLFAQSCGS